MLQLFIASDHAGYALKSEMLRFFSEQSIPCKDLGCDSENSVDYPVYAHALAKEVEKSENHYGVLICGSGIGVSITANRHSGIRAALCLNEEMASLSKQHNNANVLVLGARFLSSEEAKKIFSAFWNQSFEGGRHEKRVRLIDSSS